MKPLGLPSWATAALGLLAGVLAVLNEAAFGFEASWRSYISVVLVFLAGIGISPLVGPAFRAALHLSTSLTVLITSGLGALALAVHTLDMSEGLRGALQGVLVFAAGVGFAPSVTSAQARRLAAFGALVLGVLLL